MKEINNWEALLKEENGEKEEISELENMKK